jgi:hypothetical protein
MKNNLEYKTIEANQEDSANFKEVFKNIQVGDKIQWDNGEDKYEGLVIEKYPNYFWAITRGYDKKKPDQYLMGGVGKFKSLYGDYIAEHGFELQEDRIRYWGFNGDLSYKKKFKGFEDKNKKYLKYNKLMIKKEI